MPRYRAIIENYGFEQALEIPFDGRDGEKDTFFVYAHRDGLLLSFDTFWNRKSVNAATVRYNWRPNGDRSQWRDGMVSSGHLHKTEDVWIGDHDAREALLFKLDRLRKHGEFLNPWIERPFLWLLHYMDTKRPGYSHDAINAERIALLPAWVQEMIGNDDRT